jgi:hypothetical protein
MTSEKNPSIFYDRSTIGSSEELDEYGVWVKSEPQDLSSINADTQSADIPEITTPEDDFSLEMTDDLPDFSESKTTPWPDEVSTDMEDLADFNITSAANDFTDEQPPDIESNTLGDDLVYQPGSLDKFFQEAETEAEKDTLGDDLVYQPGSLDKFFQEAETEAEKDTLGDDLVYQPGSLDKFFQEAETEAEKDTLGDDLVYQPGSLDKFFQEAEETSSKPQSSGDISTQLLMKIADELSSIKDELSSLKKELHQVKNAAAETPTEQKGGGGFFDEEDDEKIALTGDELNNILNTADFTEETGSDATEEEAFDTGTPDISKEKESSSTGDDSFPDFTALPSEPIQGSQIDDTSLTETSITGEDIPVFDDTVDLPVEDTEISPELEHLREEGVELMTPAPEDTSFLEEDFVDSKPSEDSTFDSSLDLEGAVIEEPDLSIELKDNPIEEPSLDDFSLELDMEDISKEDETEDILFKDELNMDIPDDSNGLASDELSFDDDDPLGVADISFDDIIDVPTIEESPEPAGTSEEDTYDQVIPEGFLVESEDGRTAEGFLESAENSLSLDEVLDIEDIPDDTSIQLDSVAGEFELEEPPVTDIISDAEEITGTDDAAQQEASGTSLPDKPETEAPAVDISTIPAGIKAELRSVLSYMDQLLESLPEEKIEEFAKSKHINTYKKLFEELDLA